MGLRCLIGHDFGEVQTDRDRESTGNEVVVSIREYRECTRCGRTRVLSENKEVRTAEPEPPADAPDEGDEDVRRPEPPVGPAGDFEDVSAEEDDGLILEDEPEERGPGEWPERDDETEEAGEAEDGDDEPAPWPEVEGEDEGFAAEPDDGGPAEGVEFGGLTPEASDGQGAHADAGGVGGDDLDGGRNWNRTSGATGGAVGRTASAGVDVELYCPECDHVAPANGSSLRPGDICPSCRVGYLAEREE